MLRKALERNGYTVDEAPDGSAAIQKLRARRYQLVLTDLKMPGASGLDVLRETEDDPAAVGEVVHAGGAPSLQRLHGGGHGVLVGLLAIDQRTAGARDPQLVPQGGALVAKVP